MIVYYIKNGPNTIEQFTDIVRYGRYLRNLRNESVLEIFKLIAVRKCLSPDEIYLHLT